MVTITDQSVLLKKTHDICYRGVSLTHSNPTKVIF